MVHVKRAATLFFCCFLSLAASANHRNVLVISSVHSQTPRQAEIEQGFWQRSTELRLQEEPGGELTQIYMTDLDVLRLPGISLQERTDWLLQRYESINFDLIIALGPAAAAVAPSIQQQSGSPKIEYVDTSWASDYGLSSEQLRDPIRVLASIGQVLPDLSRLILIGSAAATAQLADYWYFDFAEQFTLEIWDPMQLSDADLHSRVEALEASAAILFVSSTSQVGSDLSLPQDRVKKLVEHASVPLFVTQTSAMIDGVAGGYLLDLNGLGRRVAEIAYGAAIDARPLNQLRYDNNQVERYNLKIDALEDEVELINENLLVYRPEELAQIALPIALSIFILLSAWVARERRQSSRLASLLVEKLAVAKDLTEAAIRRDLALDIAKVGFLSVKLDSTGLLIADERFKRLYGFDEDQAVSFVTLAEAVHPDDLHAVLKFRTLAYTPNPNAGDVQASWRIIHAKTGEVRWIRAMARQYELNGESWALGCVYDSTEESRALEELEQASKQLNEACLSGGISLIETNLTRDVARWVVAPQGVGQTAPYSGKALLNAVDPAFHADLQAAHRGEMEFAEFPIQHPGQSATRWMRDRVVRFWSDLSGDQYALILSIDVTAQRANQTELDRTRRLTEAACEAAGLGVIEANFNRSSGSWVVAPSEHDPVAWVGDALLERVDPAFHASIEASQREVGKLVDFPLDLGNRTKWVRNQLVESWVNDMGERCGLIISIDITSDRAKQEALELAKQQADEAVEQLEQKQNAQQQIFAVIGHELRTPAAALNMMLDAQIKGAKGPYSQEIRTTAKHLLEVLDDLRTVVEPSIVKQRSIESEVPASIIQSCMTALSDRVLSAGMRVEFKTDQRSQEELSFDARGLRQVATNLIKNALIHSQGSALAIELEVVSDAQVPAYLHLVLSDDGVGISPAEREGIFEPFKRGDTHADGTGLGLHICREIIRGSGGDLTLTESAQGGCCFEIKMQFSVDESDRLSDASLQAAAVDDASLEGMRILLAEDNPMLRMLTEQILSGVGAQSHSVENGQLALDWLAGQDVDLLLTDIFMPDLDGFTLVARLREQGFNRPIIGITAAMVGDESDRLLAAGADLVIPKPVTRQKLEQAWARLQREQNRTQG